MTNKKLALIITIILFLIYVATDPLTVSVHKNFLRPYEEIFLESLFLLLIGSLISVLIQSIGRLDFNTWFKKFFIWYFPLAYGLTFLFPTTGYTMIYRYDAAVLLSVLMIAVTVGVVIKQKFLTKNSRGI